MRFVVSFLIAVLLASAAGAQSRVPAAAPTAAQIDINSAGRDELMTLDDIGEVRADAIIRSRPFKAKTDLVERRVIPEALYEKIADKVTARSAPPPAPARPGPAPPRR